MAEQSIYSIKLYNSSDNLVAHLNNARKRELSLFLNQAGDFSFTLDMDDEKATDEYLKPGVNYIKLYRGSTAIFGGEIVSVRKVVKDIERYIEVRCKGWQYLLSKRFVGKENKRSFTNIDAGTIIQNLIDEAMATTNGDWGFTSDSISTAGPTRSREYERVNLGDVIKELTDIDDGVDFTISPSKRYSIYYPFKGTDRSNEIIFEFPGNILELEELNDSSVIVNWQLSQGTGWGGAEVNVKKDDLTSQGSYKRREALGDYKDIENVVVLEDVTLQDINRQKIPRKVYKIRVRGSDPVFKSYDIGDLVRVKVGVTNFSLNQIFRLYGVNINIDSEDEDMIELIISRNI